MVIFLQRNSKMVGSGNRPLIYLADGRGVLIYLTQLLNAQYRIVRYMRPLGTADYCHNADRQE